MKAYTYNDRLVGVGNDQILGTDQGGGSTYTAGNGIDITNDVISVDDTVALKTDIPVVTGFATQSWVSEQGYLTSVPSEYITDSELNATVSGLATKSELQTVSAAIPELPDEEEVEFEELDLTDYALASAIPDVSDMATQTWVGNQGYLTSVPSNYATDIEVSQAIASSIVQSDWAVTAVDSPAYIENKPETLEMEILPVYAGEGISIESNVSGIVISAQGGGTTYTAGQYISVDANNVISVTGLQVAGNYATTSDISDMATQTWVGNQGYLTEVPSTYATDAEVSEAIASSIPSFIEGNCVDITSNVISWETSAGITDIVSVTALPANPVATIIYLIPET